MILWMKNAILKNDNNWTSIWNVVYIDDVKSMETFPVASLWSSMRNAERNGEGSLLWSWKGWLRWNVSSLLSFFETQGVHCQGWEGRGMWLELERKRLESSLTDFFYYHFQFCLESCEAPLQGSLSPCSIIPRLFDSTFAHFQCFLAWQFDALYFNHPFLSFVYPCRLSASWRTWPCQIHIGCPELVFSNHYLYKWTCVKEKSSNQSFLFVLSESFLGNFTFDKLWWWRENEMGATFWII